MQTSKLGAEEPPPPSPLRRHINWSLSIGLLLLGVVVLLAIAGPSLAPQDPMKENVILQLEGEWYIPPFPLFTPSFPFGSDEFGRDLYSRVLWAVRPTLLMVLIVAAIRLVIGIIIGLTAGWKSGATARMLDTVIEFALAIPVLLVALCVIAIVGVEYGIWAFIIGLAATGWVETSQQVREQTRIVRGQAYVEAARSLGARNHQILSRHILKQITPLIVMLFAFEMSSTLMTTAGLGFLGYYIGGDVWIDVDDFVARRISGMPELGQMLATSWVTLTKPWAMVVVGTIVFTTILGFNLVGEGLRASLDVVRVGRRSLASRAKEQAAAWIDQNVWHPLTQAFHIPAVQRGLGSSLLLIALAALLAISAMRWFDLISSASGSMPGNANRAHPDQPAANPTAGSAASDSETAAANQPSVTRIEPEVIWEFEDSSGFSGGPALSKDKQHLYVASKGGILYALDLEGNITWKTTLPAGGVGTPAVGRGGGVFVTDAQGGLTKLTPGGRVLWHFQTSAGDMAHSGPVLDKEGNAYYTAGTLAKGYVQSVNPSGENRWASPANTLSFFRPPVLNTNQKLVYLKDDIFSTTDGKRQEYFTNLTILNFLKGLDGKDYLLAGNNIIQWDLTGDQIEVIDMAEWDTSGRSTVHAPSQQGVTRDGTTWMLYTSSGGNTELVWVTLDDRLLGIDHFDGSSAILAALRPGKIAYVCGGKFFENQSADCVALRPGKGEPLWEISLGEHGPVEGGLYEDGKLFLTTGMGKMFAIEEHIRSTRTPQAAATGSGGALQEPGKQWSYTYPEKLLGGVLPFLDEQGSTYALSGDFTVYGLNPDGTPKYSLPLPTGLYRIESEFDLGYLFPIVLKDGTLVIVSDENTIYAVGQDGEIKWEQAIDSGPAEWPVESETGTLYLVDQEAGLYAFDTNGLIWKFQSSAAEYTASSPVIGPDGSLYYTVTDRNNGYLQAVSADGEPLWSAQATTKLFYEPFQISADGSYILIKDNIFDAKTGAQIDYEVPEQMNRFLTGLDGRDYLITSNSISEWSKGEEGLEMLRTVVWNIKRLRYYRPDIQVDKNGVIWLNNYDELVWMNFDGEILGKVLLKFNRGGIHSFDVHNGELLECQRDAQESSLECSISVPGAAEPVWSGVIEDVPEFDPGQATLVGDTLYILTEDRTLTKYRIRQAQP